MNFIRVLRIFAAIFISLSILSAFACPVLEIIKIIKFLNVGYPYTLNIQMEYIYFVISLILPCWIFLSSVFNFCYKPDLTIKGIELKLLAWMLIWLFVSVFYTFFTRDDVGGIPFYCPSNETYITSDYYKACQLRAANFIIMWTFFVLIVMLTIFIPAALFPHDEIDREKAQDKPVDFLSLWTDCGQKKVKKSL
ncbi:hypothetical protein F8M41_015392 [Gigaspora margarita]|uniref:Uncharacterized protein n=1 Tax=Gigaspora margarita TaxID=4874 RepID=A0A8H4AQQ7_GIGMA|nr:hypothetical protein F8M41_015392 [Gigaspora margarita]